jgi:hypothetical protein
VASFPDDVPEPDEPCGVVFPPEEVSEGEPEGIELEGKRGDWSCWIEDVGESTGYAE